MGLFVSLTVAGNATRTCHDNQMWDDTDVGSCQSQFIIDVVQEVTFPLGWSSYNLDLGITEYAKPKRSLN